MKEIKLILTGKILSTQHIYKISCQGYVPRLYMSKEGKDRKLDYQWQVKTQYKGFLIKDDLEIEIELFFSDKRKRDWDNANKLIMDSMSKIIYEDDSQIQKATVIKNYDKQNPRIELVIKKYAKN